ncbi:glycosyltransferase family 4 protein [Anabaena sp. UHCC 0187]|uniref:glycosyltransferase family 4 protein n=1 Tax=Anabaena sp. UHCC 0187 TaxID=2590018 RepID=UPI0014488697|nr:glycosyltransferase family 4 protein [Anabaena sp. UHCC 0187]MTJ11418.1 glycosyltransferase family 4 protein [Anabaena sp. UHCC 0187]
MHLSKINTTPLLVASNEPNFGSHSGYSIAAKYILGCSTLFITRNKTVSLHERILNKILNTFAISSWYKISSAKLEWLIWKQIQNSNHRLIHFLWGERDLGYIDLLIDQNLYPICSTFHSCADDLPTVIPFSARNRLKNIAAIVIVSETQRGFFEECGVESHRIHCIHHGIDTDFFTPKTYLNVNQPFTLLSVGSYRRNFTYLREVFKEISKLKDIHIKIKVVSTSNNIDYFSDIENVEFINSITDAELLEVYQSASCQIISVENATANNALLEGLACGLPVIAERIGGIPEYVNEKCAILTEPGDIKSMVKSIVAISQSLPLLTSMSIAARERALELSWFNIAQKMENVYVSLMGEY